MMLRPLPPVTALFLGLVSTPALATGPGADGKAEVSLGGGDAKADADAPKTKRAKPGKRKDTPWIRRWAPERNMGELGVYGGVLLPSRRIELFEADTSLVDQGYKPLASLVPDFGLRLGYFPIRFFGVEAEGGVLPGQTEAGDSALLWTARGHLVAQLGLWSVTPFITAGAGLLGVSSDRTSVGNDVDAAAHLGGGVKFYLSRYTMLRLDVRDIIAARRGRDAGVVHSAEILLGLSITLGRDRNEAPPPPPDTDGDGILDPDDECKDEPGVAEYNGCPIPDVDGDGILDPDDECIAIPGVAEYDGCPIPDTDGDGILDPDDECKDEPGVAEYDGCPIPDTDGDGILDPDDSCVDEPETANGFQDEDGCPDEIPKEVAKFTGVIDGIFFATNKATIRDKSKPILGKALQVLQKYPSVRVEISGHTDDRGSVQHNLELSQARADAVKQWLVTEGIDASRVTTRGAGPNDPVANNKSKKGRAKNRRIEFKLIMQ